MCFPTKIYLYLPRLLSLRAASRIGMNKTGQSQSVPQSCPLLQRSPCRQTLIRKRLSDFRTSRWVPNVFSKKSMLQLAGYAHIIMGPLDYLDLYCTLSRLSCNRGWVSGRTFYPLVCSVSTMRQHCIWREEDRKLSTLSSFTPNSICQLGEINRD